MLFLPLPWLMLLLLKSCTSFYCSRQSKHHHLHQSFITLYPDISQPCLKVTPSFSLYFTFDFATLLSAWLLFSSRKPLCAHLIEFTCTWKSMPSQSPPSWHTERGESCQMGLASPPADEPGLPLKAFQEPAYLTCLGCQVGALSLINAAWVPA